METRERALRGWNWGKAEFTKAELAFNVQNRPAFEIPYSEISNTNLAGKNEVAVEFALNADGDEASKQPAGSTKNRGQKAAAGPDELVEMRFYIPGTAVKTDKSVKKEEGAEEDGEGEGEEDEVEEQNAANLFYETLMDKAEIGDVAGDTFATFLDVLHLTPRYVSPPLERTVSWVSLTRISEDVSISTCTRLPSGYGVRPTTIKSNTPPSRSSSCFRRMTTPTLLSFWVLTRRCDKVRPGIRSWLCN